jgi:hypothetical protein
MYDEAAKVKELRMKEEGTRAVEMTYSGLENKGRMTQHEGKRNSIKKIFERAAAAAQAARQPGENWRRRLWVFLSQ